MKKILIGILIAVLSLAVLAVCFILFWPLEGEVKAFSAPALQGYTGDFAENEELATPGTVDMGGYARPETVLYRDGYLYSSCHGQLIRTAEDGSGTELLFDSKDGETLGFDFDAEGNIVFADPRFGGTTPGVYRLDLNTRQVTALCTEVDGKKLTCPDAVAVAANGTVYFSDATGFSPVVYGDADYAFQYEAYFHSSRGRVCAVDPSTGESWVVADNFSGANGIAVSFDEKYLYLSETMEYSVWRIPADLRNGAKGNGAELFLSNLPGCTDNLNRGQDGRYWVGLVSPRDPSWDQMLGGTFMRKLLLHVSKPARNVYPEKGIAAAFAFDDSGAVVDFLMARDTPYNHVTGVTETDGRLYLHANNETGRIAYIEKP